MTEPRHDTHLIPDSPEYWETLAMRVAGNAMVKPAGQAGALQWLTTSTAAAIAASIAIIATVALATAPEPAATRPPLDVMSLLAPDDRIGGGIVRGEAPPFVGDLLLLTQR
jgi:hypothetical protein